jgi:plastocyanin
MGTSRVLRLIAILGLVLAVPGVVAAATQSVKMIESGGRYAFSPTSISVAAGSTVTWTNTTDAPHTVTADGGQFSSSIVNPGQTFSHTFASAGTFAYHCTVHPYMTASVIVTAAATSGGTAGTTGGTTTTPPPTDTIDFGTGIQQQPVAGLVLMLVGGASLLAASGLLWWRRRSPD